MTIDTATSLGDLVIADPRRSKVFADFELDYCCNGHRPLEEAVAEAGLDLDTVTAALDLPETAENTATQQTLENASLAHDIVDTHHAYMWAEMPLLLGLVNKVRDVHSDRHPELVRVAELFTEAITGLEPHMTTEERLIFPAITRLEKTQDTAKLPFESFDEPIKKLRDEHDEIGRIFKELRATTNGYQVPEDACASYTMMLNGLAEMETDLHEHIHKENNVLFPQVLNLEAEHNAS